VGNRFRLFFIPVITFGKKYLVRTTCCDTWYLLDPLVGKAIERKETVSIRDSDLQMYQTGEPLESRCPTAVPLILMAPIIVQIAERKWRDRKADTSSSE